MRPFVFFFSIILFAACTPKPRADGGSPHTEMGPSSLPHVEKNEFNPYASLPNIQSNEAVAIFAGGCFWCMESDFEPLTGVKTVISGYIGGNTIRPTYQQVSSRTTRHAEAIWVLYDPKIISYNALLTHYWHHIDPTVSDRQFCDVGDEYRPEIYVLNENQKILAQKSKQALQKSKPFSEPIVVNITKAQTFYPAEKSHQDFYKKNLAHYRRYRKGCRRDARLKSLWGKLFQTH